MSSKDRIEALEAGAGVVETRTGKLAGSEKEKQRSRKGRWSLPFLLQRMKKSRRRL